MTAPLPWRRRLAERLMRQAAAGLRRRYPDFAEAMVSEGCDLEGAEQLRWAIGCFVASLRAPGGLRALAYPLALTGSVVAMVLYQWSADENGLTLALTCALGVGLGLVDPRRFLLSGVAVGVVVSAVNAFETLTGVRPAYEAASHGLIHNLRWLVLVPPSVIAAGAGSALAQRLGRRDPPPFSGDRPR